MPEFIERDVQALRDSSSTESVVLLVGTRGDRVDLRSEIESIGGEVLSEVGKTTLRISISESLVDDLCQSDSIQSIEPDKNDFRTLNPGN